MRNFWTAEVTTKEVFKGPYADALAEARKRQKEINEHPRTGINESYTIEGDENGEGIVTWHAGVRGGQPPYQEIVQGNL